MPHEYIDEIKMQPTEAKIKLERLNRNIAAACRASASFSECVPVFGEGPSPSAIMFVGEAPGREETKAGRPFVGKAGKMLTSVIVEVFGGRDNVYITNTIKVWPVIKTARGKTRPPTADEKKFFLDYLKEEIGIVAPRAIAAVGKTALKALAPDKEFVPNVWTVTDAGIPLMPLYHPSYLLRKQKTLAQNTIEMKAALISVREKAAG